MDETTERPAARSLPAPTGPRSPTGPVPLTLPAHTIPPPADALPVLPYLPAAVPKAAAPATGQVPTTLAAMFDIANKSSPSPTPPPKRSHKRLIVLAIVVAVMLLLAVVFRNTAFIQRFTGAGYDTNPLPTQAFPQPPFNGAEYTFGSQTVSMEEGLPTNYWQTSHAEVNYATNVGKFTFDYANAPIIGGTIGTPQSTSTPVERIADSTMSYWPGETATDPWIRKPNESGWHTEELLSRNEVYMYQDIVDPALRSQVPVSVVSESRHEVAVTTYTYEFTFGDFYESAPRLFDLVQILDGNAPDDAEVTVTVSFDEQWLVRYLDVDLDYEAVLEYRAKVDPENHYPYRYTFEVISITDTPPAVAIPPNAVDEAIPVATELPPPSTVTP